ncbi:MAG TPA: DUF3179 domain-containing (seleno)protein [Gemmataceae bacterium]|nr:DUF3179 domain-containing (seleno)protein [Gemmataceae bacterium]
MRTLILLLSAGVVASAADPKLVVKPDAFETLVNPNCSHCVDEAKRRKDELKDTDPVLIWTRGKYDGGAIPIRFFLNPYRVISDTYGVFVYDPDAGYARGFIASVDFRFHGWRNGVMVMSHKDGTLYSCLTGVAFDGPRKGDKLGSWPTMVTNWGWAMKHYPGGVAYHMFEKYKPTELPTKANEDSVRSRGEIDKRLPAEEMVLGVDLHARSSPHAYRLADLERMGKFAALTDTHEFGSQVVILWDGTTRTAAAYLPTAQKRAEINELSKEGKVLDIRFNLEIVADGKSETAPFVDKKSGTRFDVAGRGIEGELKGWTLETTEGVVAKWFAWSAEFPYTKVHQAKDPAPLPEVPKATPPAKTDPKAALKEVAGTAEFLRNTPKHAATFKGYDWKARTVTLLIEGEKVAKSWPLLSDAEVKVMGWWGRAQQFRDGDRVWVWFACDRARQPQSVLTICDDATEKDIHGKTAEQPKEFAGQSEDQRTMLRLLWQEEGLPGTVTFAHIAGEVEVTLDHEAMRWGRSLQSGAEVKLEDLSSRPASARVEATWDGRTSVLRANWTPKPAAPAPSAPLDGPTTRVDSPVYVRGVVKDVKPWRERTRVTLVVNGVDIAPFTSGLRTHLKMPPPPKEVQEADYPPDIGQRRTKEERIEWFLASIYCTCKVGNDICTGDFYTLSSCNPNGCGMPNTTRKRIGEMIDKGMDDKQIFDDLRAERGALLTRPHLVK